MGFMDYVKSIEWEHESYPAYEDYIVLPLFALFFTSVRFFLDRFVFQVLCFMHQIYVDVFLDKSFWLFFFLSLDVFELLFGLLTNYVLGSLIGPFKI